MFEGDHNHTLVWNTFLGWIWKQGGQEATMVSLIASCFRIQRSCLWLRPENRPSVFAFFGVWSNSGWGGGGGLLSSLVFAPHDLPSDRLCTSLHISQGTLDTSSLLPCTYFMLRWIRLLCFLAYTSFYVGSVFFASLHILHITLDTSSVLPCAYVRVRWIRRLYFLAQTSCYVGYVFCTSLHMLHVTLDNR